MIKRSDRLTTVRDLAETQEQQAARQFRVSREKLEAAEKSLANLHKFRENYAERFKARGDSGLGAQLMSEYRVFLTKIGAAITDQEFAVAKARVEEVRRRAEWNEARRKVMGMTTLVDNARQEELRRAERAIQAETDERASRRIGRGSDLLFEFR